MGDEIERRLENIEKILNDQKNNPNKETTQKAPKYPFQEFMVDFLGGLVPGSFFLVGAIVVLLPSIHLIYNLSNNNKNVSIAEPLEFILEKADGTPNMIWIGIFAFSVGISYILGHLFYRRTPKKPDQKSFVKVKKIALSRKPEGVKDVEYLKTELACTDETSCEFPYPNLREYLGQRGLCHLCPFVLWKDNGTEQFDKKELYRSKTYMNLLKIRLKHHYPEKCSNIIRNEAHVRLASSTWYVTRTLCMCCYIGIAIIVGSVLFYIKIYFKKTGFNAFIQLIVGFSPFLMLPILIFSTCIYIRDRIEKVIHYQRLREVFYVLETAYTAFADRPQFLKPPFFDYEKEYSIRKCKHKCRFRPKKNNNKEKTRT